MEPSETNRATALFVYGTLTDDARVRRLTGQTFSKNPATLRGFRKVERPGIYPYIVADPDKLVEGFLLSPVDAEALRWFDEYEDEGYLYRRVQVEVTVGTTCAIAEVYVGIPEALEQHAEL